MPTVELTPIELEYLNKLRELNDFEIEQINKIIDAYLNSKKIK